MAFDQLLGCAYQVARQRDPVEVRDNSDPTGFQDSAQFASGARPESKQSYGSGLGLAISKKLLDAMGGSIDLVSPIDEAAGSGTRVILRLPLADYGETFAV